VAWQWLYTKKDLNLEITKDLINSIHGKFAERYSYKLYAGTFYIIIQGKALKIRYILLIAPEHKEFAVTFSVCFEKCGISISQG
jgi:hypothetical protein